MLRLPIASHNRLKNGEIPSVYITITSPMGVRVYGEKELTLLTWSGSNKVPITTYLEQSGKLLSFGSFERTLQPVKDNVLESYTANQLQHAEIGLNNTDAYFAKLLPTEPFLGMPISILIGFELEPIVEHITLFSGIITEISMLLTMTLTAEQGGS